MFALALLLGLGLGPVIAQYAAHNPSALYQAAGGTALTVGAMGSFGFATSRDLIRWMRPLFWALLAVFGISILLILVGSGEHLVLNIAIYVIVSAYLAIYFQIIRRVATEHDVVWIATGVFINIVNIFLTLLRIFGNSR
jgi:modulator of FtsH protease